MWDDEDDDDLEEFDKNRDKANKHPILLKIRDISALTLAIVGSMDEARKELYGSLMLEDTYVLEVKFIGAESIDDYILKMENAVMMKIHARQLNTMTYQLAMESTHAEEHLQLLRNEISEFKKLFVNWVRGFDQTEKYSDGWGLFDD